MSQHYPTKDQCEDTSVGVFVTRTLENIIKRDGLITPLLVIQVDDIFMFADERTRERAEACWRAGFSTLLVETEWTEDDL